MRLARSQSTQSETTCHGKSTKCTENEHWGKQRQLYIQQKEERGEIIAGSNGMLYWFAG